jgi:hypothetical protein
MAQDKYCPKCDSLVSDKKYHKSVKDCDTNSFNKIDMEHIHYTCTCGYDFVAAVSS